MSVTAGLLAVQQSIRDCEKKSGRKPGSVRLIAVSKQHGIDQINEAIRCGQLDFAENYVQEAIEKMSLLNNDSIVWHYIGRIQKNKISQIARHFDWVHSLSDISHVSRLNEARSATASLLNVCVQVNIDHDQNKSGMDPVDVGEMVQAIHKCAHLRYRGLMCITRASSDLSSSYHSYKKLASVLSQQQALGVSGDELSMGMSSDYKVAIEAGATMVRVGTSIFGARSE